MVYKLEGEIPQTWVSDTTKQSIKHNLCSENGVIFLMLKDILWYVGFIHFQGSLKHSVYRLTCTACGKQLAAWADRVK